MTEPFDPIVDVVAKLLYGDDYDPEDVQKLLGKTPEDRARHEAELGRAIGVVGGVGATIATVRGARELAKPISEFKPAATKIGGLIQHRFGPKAPAALQTGVEGASVAGDALLTHIAHQKAEEKPPKPKKIPVTPVGSGVKKDAPSGSDMYVPGTLGSKRKKKIRPLEDEFRKVAKAYFDLVDAAVEVGAISRDGEWSPVMKSIMDHHGRLHDEAGRFTTKAGAHAKVQGKIARDLAIAGGLGVTAALVGSRVAPASGKMAADLAEVAGKLRNPALRGEGLAQLPDALRGGSRAVGLGALAATAGVGTSLAGKDAYERLNGYRLSVKAEEQAREAKRKHETLVKHLSGDPIHEAEHLVGGTHPEQVRSKITSQASSVGPRAMGRLTARARTLKNIAEIGTKGVEAVGKGETYDVVWAGEFSKVDDDHRNVFGWASIVEKNGEPVVDLQGDYIEPAEIEKAAYHYVLNSRVGGDMHRRSEDGVGVEKSRPLHVSDLIESFMVTPEKVAKMGLPPGSLPTGWWVGFHVNDDMTWQEVKKGNRRGFSIHGVGVRKEAPIEEVDPRYALLSKAYEESDDVTEYADNLDTIAEVTGDEIMKALAMNVSRQSMQTQDIARIHDEAMQRATEMLAPQVAAEIQRIQQEQMLAMQQAQQAGGQQAQTHGQGQYTQSGMQQGPQSYGQGPAQGGTQVQQGPANYAG